MICARLGAGRHCPLTDGRSCEDRPGYDGSGVSPRVAEVQAHVMSPLEEIRKRFRQAVRLSINAEHKAGRCVTC